MNYNDESLDLYNQTINYIDDYQYHIDILLSYIEKNKNDVDKMRNILINIRILIGVIRNVTCNM